MIIRSKIVSILSAVAFASGFAVTIHAAGLGNSRPAGSRPGATERAAEEAAEVTALRPAFMTLLSADHDYKGHRVAAMKDIAEACKIMGTDIVPAGTKEKEKKVAGATSKPAGTEPEQQSLSDTQLKQVQATVQQVRNSIPAGKQPKIGELLDDAVKELGMALTVK